MHHNTQINVTIFLIKMFGYSDSLSYIYQRKWREKNRQHERNRIMERQINLILRYHKKGNITTEEAKNKILALCDVSNSVCVNCGKVHDDHRPKGGLCFNKKTFFKAK